MRQDIEDYCTERQIPYLLHFTQAANIPGIMAHGLMPRASLDDGEIAGISNDDLRLDGRRNYNCLSIAFPNAPMFHRLKQADTAIEWPILVINPSIMSRRNTLFCWKNAACNDFSHAPDEELSSINAFKRLYVEHEEVPSRADQLLKTCDPTHVQAEVMVEGRIPPSAIYAVIFPSVPCINQYRPHIGDRQVVLSSRRGYYGTRDYYRRWGVGK